MYCWCYSNNMHCIKRSDSKAEGAKPLKIETMNVKEELDPNEIRTNALDVQVKSEPLIDTDGPPDVVVNVEVTCLTKGDIKEEPAVLDKDVRDPEDYTTSSHNVKLEICVIKEPCASPAIEDFVIEDDDGPQECKLCHKIFNCRSSLNNHMSGHDEEKSNIKKIKEPREQIMCKVCGLIFPSLSTYLKHRHMHLLEKPFVCEICKKKCNSKYLLSNHERIHTGERPYSCSQCDKKFSEQVNLKRHELVHSGQKRFSCNVCQKTFSLKHNLALHMRSHTNDKPYKCDTCNIQFTHKPYLKRHLRIHTGEKPYSCDICKKSFARKHYLNFHIRSHNNDKPYACDICDKRFTNKYDNQKHLKVHVGKKKYPCDFCNEIFTQKSQLINHVLVHNTDSRTYSCSWCGKRFVRKCFWTKHLQLCQSKTSE